MTVPSPASRLIGRQRISRSAAGLSLVELMIVILIVSILFVAAIPAYQRIQRKARASALVNDFRVFGAVFQSYAHEKGAWPLDTPPGVLPIGLTADDLQIDAWSKTTPMGGQWNWELNTSQPFGPGGSAVEVRAALVISDANIDADLMQEIDDALDDGDPNTGNFRHGFLDAPTLIIEP
jgi:prepilin-type N-terminal cleavage/methylation domain-containing protein